jgi:4-alpha-glucanotransferase
MIQEAAGKTAVVAEDLGLVPKYVPKLLKKLGIPGFTIPQFLVDPETREFVPKDKIDELTIATWGSHDHGPIVSWYTELTKRWHSDNGHEAWLELQRLMRFLGENENNPPETFTDHLHQLMLWTLLKSKACWTIFIISDILGVTMRFNHPGTANDDNWSQRLDRPLSAYVGDHLLGPKLKLLRDEIEKSDRMPQ